MYLVCNSISNLRTQAEQVQCFANAAPHLLPGGRSWSSCGCPTFPQASAGAAGGTVPGERRNLGFDTYDVCARIVDLASLLGASRRGFVRRPGHSLHLARRVDLMGQLAGLELEARYADWQKRPFTSESEGHISIRRKP